MSISSIADHSLTARVIRFLFIDGKCPKIKSFFIIIANKLTSSRLALFFLIASITCFFYESILVGTGLDFVIDYHLATILLVVSLIFCDKSNFLNKKTNIYLFIFILAMIISSVFAAFYGINSSLLLLGILLFSHLFLAFLITSSMRNIKLVTGLLLLVSLPLLVVGIIQYVFGSDTSRLWISTSETLISRRAFGFFGSPNILGSVASLCAIISLFTWLQFRKVRYLIISVLSCVVLVMTFSRSAWIGLAGGLLIAVLIKNWRFIILAPVGLVVLLIPSIKQRIMTMFSQSYMVDASLDGRIWSLKNSLYIFKNMPLIGTGPGTYGGELAIIHNSPVYLHGYQGGFVALPYTDNQWSQILVQTGIIGSLALLGFFISIFLNNLKRFRLTNKYLHLGVVAALVALLLNGLFANIMEFGSVSVLAGAYLGLGNNYEK